MKFRIHGFLYLGGPGVRRPFLRCVEGGGSADSSAPGAAVPVGDNGADAFAAASGPGVPDGEDTESRKDTSHEAF